VLWLYWTLDVLASAATGAGWVLWWHHRQAAKLRAELNDRHRITLFVPRNPHVVCPDCAMRPFGYQQLPFDDARASLIPCGHVVFVETAQALAEAASVNSGDAFTMRFDDDTEGPGSKPG